MSPLKRDRHRNLSRRERQIMDILFRRGEAAAAEVQAEMPEPPSYSAVRAHLRTLEDKGHVRHESKDLRYVYLPTVRPGLARRSAVRHLVDTFFGGSSEKLMAALLDGDSAKLGAEELDRLSAMIEKARKEGL
ncbi:MAG: BlaI/MecI/CopY family transcriptional regulator [Acidobacteriales bacterium]|nr:MAG: BlaI/MecI/CopY family transcriptional regulator [Terriglobales bacterium]